MSRSRKDKSGGHDKRKSGMYSCGCCEKLAPALESTNRTVREREAMQVELSAEKPEPHSPYDWRGDCDDPYCDCIHIGDGASATKAGTLRCRVCGQDWPCETKRSHIEARKSREE